MSWQPRPRPEGDDESAESSPPQPNWRPIVLVALAALALSVFVLPAALDRTEDLDYSEFVTLVESGDVDSVTIDAEGRVDGEMSDGTVFETVIPTTLPQEELRDELAAQDVEITAQAPSSGVWRTLLVFLLPILLIGGLIWFAFRRARSQMGDQLSQMQGVGQSKAQIIEEERPDITFDDVAGYEEIREEVSEIIDYLRDPERFRKVGARGPGGVLLLGPPGTGKTLMARAIAGEADVPFISASGSEFVEMLVGVGAARVRDLFEKARERQPAIIFIDELDSVGRKRGSQQNIGSNNEQEQTLNQLLKELDGFDPRSGIVILGATNRPEMLDDALLRPGRFDRHVEVALPTQDDRTKILGVHVRGKPVADDVDLETVARGTPGFSGAQLENLVNEAAINAVRRDRDEITAADFEEARDKLIIGKRQGSDILRDDEKKRVAVHEAGHALVAAAAENGDPVAKVTILPARQALGTTEQMPLEERRLAPESFLADTLAVRLGGRAAESLVFGELSTGAAEDLAGATELATKMVREFGLSEELGPVGYRSQDDGAGIPGLETRPYGEDVQHRVDAEVARILRESEERAERLLTEHRDAFDQVVQRLLDQEIVDGSEIYGLLGKPVPGAPQSAGTRD